MDLSALKRQVAYTAKEMAVFGLARMTSGNVSAKDPQTGLIAITPSGFPCHKVKETDVVVINSLGQVVDGQNKPSSETPLHTEIYKHHPSVLGIVHTHSTYATVFAVLNKEIPLVTIPLRSFGPVRVAPFEPPGSMQLAAEVSERIDKCPSAVLMQYHGAVCVGETVEKALEIAVYLEEGAHIALLARMAE